MEALKKLYSRALDGIGDMGSFKSDWRWVLLYSVCIYAAVLALRLSFADRWDHPELWVNGERIMATHDAYFWLAKTKGIGGGVGAYPLAKFDALVSSFLNVSPGTAAFWLPAVVGAGVSIVAFLWGWLLGGPAAGIFAGLAGAMAPGFFYRSRLGYFDTDSFTMLSPMLVSWMLAYWSTLHLRAGWFSDRGGEAAKAMSRSMWLPLAFGLIARVAALPHQDIVQFNLMCTFMAFGVVIIGGRAGYRANALYGLTVFWLAAFPGAGYGSLHLWPVNLLTDGIAGTTLETTETIVGIVVAAGLATVLSVDAFVRRDIARNKYVFWGIMVLAGLLGLYMVREPLAGSWNRLVEYFIPSRIEGVADQTATLGPVYPSIVQSIIEARGVSLSEVLSRGVFASWVGYLSLLSMVVAVVLRPAAVFLLPLLGLHLLSLKLGARFTMFGGTGLLVSLGVCVYWLCRWVFSGLARREALAIAAQVALGAAVLFYCHDRYSALPMTPVISRDHAEALVELGKNAERDARVWTWWDWGYATQYYAGLSTVVDGGRHSGSDVFPVGYALSTASPEDASRMIRFSAQYLPLTDDMGLDPNRAWAGIPRDQLNEQMTRLLADANAAATPPQYLVVSWKDLLITKWISFFGNWDLSTGETNQASVGVFKAGQLGINPQRGAIMNRQGGGGLVKDIVMLDRDGAHAQHYFMNSMSPQLIPTQQHLIVNKVTGESVLMDRTAYRSMVTQLMIGDPADPEIAKYFKLVVDKLPFVRIYEVVQNVK